MEELLLTSGESRELKLRQWIGQMVWNEGGILNIIFIIESTWQDFFWKLSDNMLCNINK